MMRIWSQPRGHGFFDAVLNDGLVDEREHFLGLGFGGGQEARAEAGGGENGFADFHGMRRPLFRCLKRGRDHCNWSRLRLANGRLSEQQNPHFSRRERARNGAPLIALRSHRTEVTLPISQPS